MNTPTLPAVGAQVEPPVRPPHKLNDDAIVLAGLAETLQRRFDDAQSQDGIDDALNLSWAYEALSQLAKTLADRISDYAA